MKVTKQNKQKTLNMLKTYYDFEIEMSEREKLLEAWQMECFFQIHQTVSTVMFDDISTK